MMENTRATRSTPVVMEAQSHGYKTASESFAGDGVNSFNHVASPNSNSGMNNSSRSHNSRMKYPNYTGNNIPCDGNDPPTTSASTTSNNDSSLTANGVMTTNSHSGTTGSSSLNNTNRSRGSYPPTLPSNSYCNGTGNNLQSSYNNSLSPDKIGDRKMVVNMSYTNYALSPECYETDDCYVEEFQEEFLPVCDALFNVISLAAYFCNIVFDSLTAYSFYNDEMWVWAGVSVMLISVSVILSQFLSFRWYKMVEKRGGGQDPPCSPNVLYLMHLGFCGVLWRYFKLFIPVDLRFVKNEVRDLCLLRLVHGFCEAAPMLLIQLYLILLKKTPEETTVLNIVSTALSLFNVCWALASFSKNIRRQNVHKLVLTWLGVIFQFFWRLGTVSSRVIVLCVYATIYSYWVFLVIVLHWFCMFMWLISPKNIFHGEKMSALKKTSYAALIAVVYVFCYINIQESNSRQKLVIFYVTMFLENALLFCVWLIAVRNDEFWFKEIATSLVFSGFLLGIAFMSLYYKYFHVTKLSYAYETGTTSTYRDSRGYCSTNGNYYTNPAISSPFTLRKSLYSCRDPYNYNLSPEAYNISGRDPRLNGQLNKGLMTRLEPGRGPNGRTVITKDKNGRSVVFNKTSGHHIHHPNVPGVFNCRFHPGIKRKKKKPTSFVPPPAVSGPNTSTPSNGPSNRETGYELHPDFASNDSHISPPSKSHPIRTPLVGANGKMANPFWKRPLSVTMGSENEGSVGSRVDIQQKLQEKKQQQLAELREIEEEIKQGKLKRPHLSEIPEPVSERQPIPCEKKQPWFRTDPPVQLSPRPPIIVPPSDQPNELVLDPSCLMYSSINGFYEQPDWNFYEPLYQNDVEANMAHGGRSNHPGLRKLPYPNSRESIYKSYRIPSDIDSQMSLPRSYTLPREFKYKRKLRKPIKNEQFLPSTNSSDGDVDSGEEDPEIYSHLHPYPLPLPSIRRIHMPNSAAAKSRQSAARRHRLHETKL